LLPIIGARCLCPVLGAARCGGESNPGRISDLV
jgi:hypothetical protein